MVAEVVLSVMGNRSDRRFLNLSCAWALEAVWLTRRRRADFHQGPERKMKLPEEAEYMAATASPSTRHSPFARGWVHIRQKQTGRFPLRSFPDRCDDYARGRATPLPRGFFGSARGAPTPSRSAISVTDCVRQFLIDFFV